MNRRYRLTNDDLFEALSEWDNHLKSTALVVACGGTALTLNGYKESTKDVDFLVPEPKHFKSITKVLELLGYQYREGTDYLHPELPWIFQLYQGQTIFQTALLDPIQEKDKHKVIRKYKHLILGSLNSPDLIISKMFRGTDVDVQDCIALLKAEPIDLYYLAQRYRETADYYYNPTSCKKNLHYLIDAMYEAGIDPKPLKEMSKQWIP